LTAVPEITVDELLARYEALLLDAYGVLVNSAGALPGAPELIARLNAGGRRYLVLTNDASKLPETGAARYRRFGLALEAERIVTSGGLLTGYFATHDLRGAATAVLGGADTIQYAEAAGGRIVPADERFTVLVLEELPSPDAGDAALTTLYRQIDAGARVHLVVPNPDLVYPSGADAFGFASGAIALMFEAALRVRYPDRPDLTFARLGKPYPAMFEEALRRTGTRNMVMVGDQLETDIRGARAFGLDAALLEGGVVASAVATSDGIRPTYRLRSLG
jgi:HAD superfamily hydrolase (TIGR01459 family)